VVQVLAAEFDNFFLVMDLKLANCAHLLLLIIMVDRRFFTLVYFVERDLVLVLIDLVEDPRVLLEPLLSCFLPHDVHGSERAQV